MTGFLTDPLFLEHDSGPGHPEQPARLQAIERHLRATCLWELLGHEAPHEATVEQIARCHDREYITHVERACAQAAGEPAGRIRLGADTGCSELSFRAAVRAAGAVVAACDAVAARRVANAFCAVRPPGHHARPAAAMGFCLFGNVAIAARHCQKDLGCEKIAILDWDVHHGNGTQEIFYDDPSVLFVSIHQHPHYPGGGEKEETGKGPGKGTTVNLPFEAGTEAKRIVGAVEEVLHGTVKAFDPDFLLISAGFDSAKGDPLGGFRLLPEDFGALTRTVRQVADECCGGRVVSVLEGGYNLASLGPCVEAHLEAMREVR